MGLSDDSDVVFGALRCVIRFYHPHSPKDGRADSPLAFAGLFLASAILSVYLLLRSGVRRSLVAIQLFAVSALLLSTTIYWAAVALQVVNSLETDPNEIVNVGHHKDASLGPQCAGTAMLTVNIILSDLVVWWRVWVLWHDSRVLYRWLVYICGGILLSTTFAHASRPPATGVVDTNISCHNKGGFMYEGVPVGTVASMFSLAANLVATALTAYKAWVHRRCIRSNGASGSPRSTQVEYIFALLVESGALYCALWIVVVVWQTGSWLDDPRLASSFLLSLQISHKHKADSASFWFKGGVLIEGCLVPLIVRHIPDIIILVALNKSAIGSGSKSQRDKGAAGPPGINVAIETVVSTYSDADDLLPRTGGRTDCPGSPSVEKGIEESEKMAYAV
uniref:Cytochrome P450 monooxygenase AKT7 ) n=1 Tax=Ganoderma boninense TaxID=34458 RepID=A0A5K1JYV4_9APHY|nr:Cytochrome P450 monooxygenase AKT7 (EC (AK-toxin biosynthesis protein 7) [Ganoderma boninense]